MLPDRLNPRLWVRDWLNKPSRADMARPSLQEQIVSNVAQHMAAGRVAGALQSQFTVAVNPESGRAVGTRLLGGTDINFSLPEGVEARRHTAADGTTYIDLVESPRPERIAPLDVDLEFGDVPLADDRDRTGGREDDPNG